METLYGPHEVLGTETVKTRQTSSPAEIFSLAFAAVWSLSRV